jgi:hypothetical protein
MSCKLLRGAVNNTRAKTLFVSQDAFWRSLEIPYETHPRKHPQEVIGRIYLPPAKSLPRAALKRMVVVVPTFAHGEKSKKPVVARIVASHIARAAAHVGERIDAERRVINENGAPKKTDHQARPSCSKEAEGCERQGWQELEPMQEPQFWKSGEIGNLPQVGGIVPASKNPPDMAVNEALVAGGMRIVLGVGMQMVMPMHCGPP